MDAQTLYEKQVIDYHSNVDTTSPFRSVKEAVAIFGERLLAGELYSRNPFINTTISKLEITSYRSSPSPIYSSPIYENEEKQITLVDNLKKLEAELEETKVELKLLKERESETEVALASLNAELHKNMSKMAEAEAAAAAKAVAATRSGRLYPFGGENNGTTIKTEEERKRDLMLRIDQSPTLAQILSISEKQAGYFGGIKERKMKKKKPIIPLVVDLFSLSSRKKRSSATTLQNPLYSTPHGLWN